MWRITIHTTRYEMIKAKLSKSDYVLGLIEPWLNLSCVWFQREDTTGLAIFSVVGNVCLYYFILLEFFPSYEQHLRITYRQNPPLEHERYWSRLMCTMLIMIMHYNRSSNLFSLYRRYKQQNNVLSKQTTKILEACSNH